MMTGLLRRLRNMMDEVGAHPAGTRAASPGGAGSAELFSVMNETERLSKLRHDLSNPLSALLAETQLLLLNEERIDPETIAGLREIEALAIRMRSMLREG